MKCATPKRPATTASIVTTAAVAQSTPYLCQNIFRLSHCKSKATGMMMSEASKLAARTDVACVEITTAPLTISTA